MTPGASAPQDGALFMPHPSRRRFLEDTLLMAASTLGAGACQASGSRRVAPGKRDEIQVAVIGLRGRGRAHIKAFQNSPDARVAAICDVDEAIIDFAEKAAREPTAVSQADVDLLKEKGLADREVFDIALAVAARAFLTTLIESLGTGAEQPWVDDLEPELLAVLEVGRPAR